MNWPILVITFLCQLMVSGGGALVASVQELPRSAGLAEIGGVTWVIAIAVGLASAAGTTLALAVRPPHSPYPQTEEDKRADNELGI